MSAGIFGIDVSHWQGLIDWQKIKNDTNVKFVIMKAQYESRSHRIDEYFERNYNGAGNVNIKRGVYAYFSNETLLDPVQDANDLISKIAGKNLEFGVWLDIEDKCLQKTPKSNLEFVIFKYARIIQDAGFNVGIYCNLHFYKNVLPEAVKEFFPIWLARYPLIDQGIFNANSSLKPSPELAIMWQYSSKGKIKGISGNVDLNICFLANMENIMTQKNPYPLPEKTLRFGDVSSSVKWLQYELIRNDFCPGLIDGIFLSQTLQEVKYFQKLYGLEVDGIVGAKTLKAFQDLQK